jgi:putative FmdB family regulatory protein
MPIYEYRCDEGHAVEVMQAMSEDALTECPECGAPTRRVLHSPAIHFKGSGFHNTDYGTRSANKAKQAASSSESGGDSTSSGSSDTSSSGSRDSGSSGEGSKAKGSDKPAKAATPSSD